MNRSLSVVLPVGLIEGLAYNHRIAHPGSRFSFPSAALYAMAELRHDLEDEVGLAADGIPIPPPWPAAACPRGRDERTSAHGFYSMGVPGSFADTWAWLLARHGGYAPTVVYRAMLHQYRCVRRYYAENDPTHLDHLPKF
jgi:hypothetical protein